MTTPVPVRPRGPAPAKCPQCLGHGEAVIYTMVLGWECSGCRMARQWAPGKTLFGQAAVDARRAANRPTTSPGSSNS